jgi:UDP-N-acetylmuramoylalanine--D-glutamate ligase
MIFATASDDGRVIAGNTHPFSGRVAGRSILVIGMARSGLAAAVMLADAKARVFVSEAKDKDAVAAQVKLLEARRIACETGGHTMRGLEGVDFVVVSPGVPASNPLVITAQQRGVPILSELEVAFWLSEGSIVAVTGSNGKTTTTAWLGAIYHDAGRAAEVGGNIGRAFSEFAAGISPGHRAILEVSTFQLERIQDFRPHLAVLLNLSPDHLDRHGTYDEYIRLKFRLLENQTPADTAILNADDSTLTAWDKEHPSGRGRRWWFSANGPVTPGVWLAGDHLEFDTGKTSGVIPGSNRLIPPGEHNRMNAAAAVAVALADGLTPGEIAPGLSSFPGVEHRLEHVAEVNHITFVNDSKATNPDAVAKAIVSFDRPLIVLMGGLDKGTDFRCLAAEMKRRARALVFTGRAAPKLEVELGADIPYRSAARFDDAFAAAAETAQPGDIVLLSPGCASFDQFDNYEHRGRVFKQLVMDFAKEAATR